MNKQVLKQIVQLDEQIDHYKWVRVNLIDKSAKNAIPMNIYTGIDMATKVELTKEDTMELSELIISFLGKRLTDLEEKFKRI